MQAGPQLVVPVLNARFAANAANARWGSLYDALYGTDVLSEDDGCERGTSYNPRRGAEVISLAREFLDEYFPLASGSHADARGYSVEDGALVVTLDGGCERAGGPGPVRRPPRRPRRARGCPPGPPRAARRDPDRCRRRDRQGRCRRGQGPPGRGSRVHDHGPRGLHRRRGHRRQGGGLPQLAPAQPRHAHRAGRQGRRDVHADARAGPGLRQPRRSGRPARSLAALRPPGRAPDDHRRSAGRSRRRGPRRHPRRRGDRPLQPGRPAGPRRAAQLADRLDVCGEAEDARPGRGRVHRRPVRAHRGPAGPGPRHDQARHHGRGAPYLRQPQGLHPRRPRPGRVHQHRIPRPDRRRAAHVDAGRADGPQGRHEVAAVDRGLRGPIRRHRPRVRVPRPRADRQGHVGDARRDGGHARAEDRPPEGRRHLRLGAVADRGDAARAALPPGRRGRPAARARGSTPRHSRPAADRPDRRPVRRGRRRTGARRSTTTSRASSAT